MKQQMSEDVVIVADLNQQYLVPPSLAYTDLRPDLQLPDQDSYNSGVDRLFRDEFSGCQTKESGQVLRVG